MIREPARMCKHIEADNRQTRHDATESSSERSLESVGINARVELVGNLRVVDGLNTVLAGVVVLLGGVDTSGSGGSGLLGLTPMMKMARIDRGEFSSIWCSQYASSARTKP